MTKILCIFALVHCGSTDTHASSCKGCPISSYDFCPNQNRFFCIFNTQKRTFLMAFLTFFALQRRFSIRDEGNFTSVNCIKTYRKSCWFSKSYLEIQIFFSKKKRKKSDFFIKRNYLKLLPRKERRDNYSWRNLNPRPLELPLSYRNVCFFLLEVWGKMLGARESG